MVKKQKGEQKICTCAQQTEHSANKQINVYPTNTNIQLEVKKTNAKDFFSEKSHITLLFNGVLVAKKGRQRKGRSFEKKLLTLLWVCKKRRSKKEVHLSLNHVR